MSVHRIFLSEWQAHRKNTHYKAAIEAICRSCLCLQHGVICRFATPLVVGLPCAIMNWIFGEVAVQHVAQLPNFLYSLRLLLQIFIGLEIFTGDSKWLMQCVCVQTYMKHIADRMNGRPPHGYNVYMQATTRIRSDKKHKLSVGIAVTTKEYWLKRYITSKPD